MKKLILLICILPTMAAAQKDLTQKEAFQNFKKSEARIKVKTLSISDFKKTYTQAKCIKKNWGVMLKDMPVFKKDLPDSVFVDNGKYRQSLFGLGDTIFPSKDDTGKRTITCNAFTTY